MKRYELINEISNMAKVIFGEGQRYIIDKMSYDELYRLYILLEDAESKHVAK